VSGTGIAAGTTVSTVTNPSTIVLSQNATANGTVTITFTPGTQQQYVANISSAELSGTGYTSGFAGSGRKTLASAAATEDDTSNLAKLTAANVTWTAINAGTASAVVIYKNGTSDSDSQLIAYIDSGGFPVVTSGGDVTVSWNSSGIITLS
jgi:hypothetical protein